MAETSTVKRKGISDKDPVSWNKRTFVKLGGTAESKLFVPWDGKLFCSTGSESRISLSGSLGQIGWYRG